MDIPLHIHRDALTDMFTGAYPVDALLHFAMATIGPLRRVRSRGQQRVIQEGERLFQVGREKFV